MDREIDTGEETSGPRLCGVDFSGGDGDSVLERCERTGGGECAVVAGPGSAGWAAAGVVPCGRGGYAGDGYLHAVLVRVCGDVHGRVVDGRAVVECGAAVSYDFGSVFHESCYGPGGGFVFRNDSSRWFGPEPCDELERAGGDFAIHALDGSRGMI